MKKIQISCLGSFGRFGNQLFQYAFARAYAEKHGCVLETPHWGGRSIFGLRDPLITDPLPKTELDQVPFGEVNIDLFGYFQTQQFVDYYSRDWLKDILKVVCDDVPRCAVAVHVRRGDYLKLKHLYCLPTVASYWEAMETRGYDPDKAVWVSDIPPMNDELWDFLRLKNADVLFRANSTFSWWAATLGSGEVYSPVVNDLVGVQDVKFVKGNHPKMFKDFTDIHLK